MRSLIAFSILFAGFSAQAMDEQAPAAAAPAVDTKAACMVDCKKNEATTPAALEACEKKCKEGDASLVDVKTDAVNADKPNEGINNKTNQTAQ